MSITTRFSRAFAKLVRKDPRWWGWFRLTAESRSDLTTQAERIETTPLLMMATAAADESTEVKPEAPEEDLRRRP